MKTRDDGLRVSGKRFEYVENRWLDRKRSPASAVGLIGRAGAPWAMVESYLLWYGPPSWQRLEAEHYRGVYEQGQRERAERAAAFARIQAEAPDVAALMVRVREVFGPGAGVGATVDIGGERVWPVEVER